MRVEVVMMSRILEDEEGKVTQVRGKNVEACQVMDGP